MSTPIRTNNYWVMHPVAFRLVVALSFLGGFFWGAPAGILFAWFWLT